MIIQAHQPKDELLKTQIECYYFVRRHQEDKAYNYFTYPSTNTIFTISVGGKPIFDDNRIILEPTSKPKLFCTVTPAYNNPVHVLLKSETSEVTIYFKPLSIFNFIDINNQKKIFTAKPIFNKNENIEEVFKEILAETNESLKIEKLELFLRNQFQRKQLVEMEKALKIIHKRNDVKIDELADQLNISRKKLNQLFKRFVGRSPSNYRKVLRFRKALKQNSNDLTSLAYTLGFFDQSHMIKEFKDITGKTPKTFFKKIKSIENNSIKWVIEE